MNTRTLTLSILLLAIVLAPLTMAEEPARRGPRGGQGRGNFQGRPDRLELTEEQRTEIKGIFEDSKEDRQASRTAVQEGMKALHEAAEDGTEAEIIAAGKELGDALTNQALQKSATMKAVKAVLTDEQVAQLDEIKAEMKERMQQRREKGQDGPRGKRGKGRKPRTGKQQRPPQEEE
ncbi:MAG: Spy/CpxP family protein refolding chaperone [Planctomycetota bacterium]|jgi:Spy/CpxP family protein refolding chaperone